MRDESLITSYPDVVSGAPVFAGTRVPVAILFEYLEAGSSLLTFLDEFPSVGREQAVAVLESAKERTLEAAQAG